MEARRLWRLTRSLSGLGVDWCGLRSFRVSCRAGSKSERRPIGPPLDRLVVLDELDAVVLQWQRPDTLAGGREERVHDGRCRHEYRGLADASPETAGGHDDRL